MNSYSGNAVMVSGSQGHAGTVPMYMRRDHIAASSGLILSLESICNSPLSFVNYDEQCGSFTKNSLAGLACTVGEISWRPSASNVILARHNTIPLSPLLTYLILLKYNHVFK